MRREQWEALKVVLDATKNFAESEYNKADDDAKKEHWRHDYNRLVGMVNHTGGEYIYHNILSNPEVAAIKDILSQHEGTEPLSEKMDMMFNHWVWRQF